LVTLITDLAKVQQYQKNHGEWVETMRNSLGKVAKIVKIYGDGDLRIQEIEDGFSWTVNPKCVKLERPALQTVAERSNSMMDLSHQRPDHVMTPLSGISGSSAADNFVREAAQGKLEYVQQYLE
jgi:E3 ubiquitin-protein ligase mind-bomb